MKKFSLVPSGFTFLVLVAFLASSCSLLTTSSLDQAVQYKNINEVRRHLNEGANVNQKDENGQTALHYAAQRGYTEVARTLIERGAWVNPKDKEGRTPLIVASEIGYTPMIDLLIAKGANIHSQDKDGRFALHHAVLGAGSEAALLLISKGAKVDARDNKKWTPLYLASVNDQPGWWNCWSTREPM